MSRHPSEYSTTPLGAVHVMVVDAGTVITDERTGKQITVDDNSTAYKGSVVWCTQKIFDELKTRTTSHDDRD